MDEQHVPSLCDQACQERLSIRGCVQRTGLQPRTATGHCGSMSRTHMPVTS